MGEAMCSYLTIPSAVDTKTDAAIREALTRHRKNITTIIISHRITTLMEADKIFVIKDGHVVEEGNHEELMNLGGIYRRTYDIQNAVAEEGVMRMSSIAEKDYQSQR